MPVVSGYYLDMMRTKQGVRIGLMMFAAAAAVAATVRALFLKETLDLRDEDGKHRNGNKNESLISVFQRQPRVIWAMLVVAVISGFAMRMTWSFLSIYAVNVIELTKMQYGMLQTVAMGISVPLYLVSGMIADRFGRVPCILLARGLGPFDSLSLLLFRSYDHLIAAYGVIGIAGRLGGGRIRGGGYMGGPAWQALISDIVPSKDRGKVMGMMGTVNGIIGLPASFIGGLIYDQKPSLLLAVGSGLESLAIPLIILFVKEPKIRLVEAEVRDSDS